MLLWLSFLYGSYNGAMVVALTEIVPVSVRTAGFSLAYSLATALFGGFTPAGVDVADRGNRQQRGARVLDGVWRRLRFGRNAGDVSRAIGRVATAGGGLSA